jgi:hypothetical protein
MTVRRQFHGQVVMVINAMQARETKIKLEIISWATALSRMRLLRRIV